MMFPSDLAPAPDGSGRLFVTDLGGAIHVLDGTGNLLADPYHAMNGTQTLRDGDTAFTSLAFHPEFANPLSAGFGKFYAVEPEIAGTATATFSPQHNSMGTSYHHQDVLYEYTVANPAANTIGSFTKREILRANQPLHNHNLNDLTFDANGLLYLSTGDGGNHATNRQNSPLLNNIYGKILRIDPLGLQGNTSANGQYSIPTSNPFVGQGGNVRGEILAYGLRNPYRISIDTLTGNLLIADVGQDNVEEINLIPNVLNPSVGGQNFGWPGKEGSFLFPPNAGSQPTVVAGLVDPVLQYDHEDGSDVIGGFVYRGSLLPELYGKYIFADHQGPRDADEPIPRLARLFYGDLSTGEIFEFNDSGLGDSLPTRILSIGQDQQGEIYVLGVGGVYAIVPEPEGVVLIALGCLMGIFLARNAPRTFRTRQ
jgi:glucose/arabinose dehydrogenase